MIWKALDTMGGGTQARALVDGGTARLSVTWLGQPEKSPGHAAWVDPAKAEELALGILAELAAAGALSGAMDRRRANVALTLLEALGANMTPAEEGRLMGVWHGGGGS